MPLDGISTKLLATELHERLSGGRIDKIYQPDRYDLYLSIRNARETVRLLLSANPSSPRAHITTATRENPALPPGFCMLLRKHLSGSRILDISASDYERILRIRSQSVDELGDPKIKHLIIEMMGRYSNIILTNEENTIIDSLLHVDESMSRVREVMPARKYLPPPPQDKYNPTKALAEIHAGKLPILSDSMRRPLEKALQESLLGFSPLLSREICHLAQIDPRVGTSQLSDEEIHRLLTAAESLLMRIESQEFAPGVYRRTPSEAPYEFHALHLQDAGCYTPCPTLSEAMDTVWFAKDNAVDFEQKKKNLLKICNSALTHATRKLTVHEQDWESCRDLETWQKYGRLLLANHYQIPENATYYDAIDYEAMTDQNTDQTPMVRIPIQNNKTISWNAEQFFKRYAKEKTRRASAAAFLEEDKKTVEYLTSLCQIADNAETLDDIPSLKEEMIYSGLLSTTDKKELAARKRQAELNEKHPGKSKSGNASGRAMRAAAQAAAKRTQQNKKASSQPQSSDNDDYRKHQTTNGFKILCGRNNLQNDRLTLKTAHDEDIWFHVKNMPGTHVILRCEGRTPSEKDIEEAAGIAAYYSRSTAKSGTTEHIAGNMLPVDYCSVKNVKKPPKARPGMVIYERYRSMMIAPLHPDTLKNDTRESL